MKLLFLKCGEASPELVARCGTYESWFRAFMDIDWDRSEPREPGWCAPDLGPYAGVVVSGSPASLTAPDGWMEDVAELARSAAQRGRPVLGVCFGHQLLGWAYGAQITRNPRGWELGTQEVELTEAGRADPLFADLPSVLEVNETHEDIIDETGLPADLRVLAGNAQTPVQALAWQEHVRGVQFHPEIGQEISREYCMRRRPYIGDEQAAALAAQTRDTPVAARVLANFVDRFVKRA
jgi:GMP synthase (glutamine-hydrolysing)